MNVIHHNGILHNDSSKDNTMLHFLPDKLNVRLGWNWMHVCRNPSLGLATKAKACKDVGQEACERVWGWRVTLPNELPFWELEFRWTPEPSESDCNGQNTLHQRVLYIIEKILKFKCLKWACMTHLDICNTSYGKKKRWESNWQFDSWPRNVKNWPDLRVCKRCETHCWKALDESYNFASDLISIKGLNTKL
jgi:hypothetical protein